MKTMTLDELVTARGALGSRWDAAFLDDDLDRMDEVMTGIREISAEIARHVTTA